MNIIILTLFLSFLLIAGCGGGGDSSSASDNQSPTKPRVTTATGQFVDSTVAGLSYRSGEQTGITDAKGEFTYEVIDGNPQAVSFSIGSLELGSSTGADIITPFDIASNDLHETNIARLLLALDEDGTPDNGISINTTIVENYDSFNWSSIDLTVENAFSSNEMNVFISDIFSITQTTMEIPDSNDTETHLSQTYNCLVSGNYYGEYNGDENGPVVVGIDPHTGSMSGVGWSRNRSTGFGFPFGQQIISRHTSNKFSLTSNDNLAFTGEVNGYSTMSGSWSSDVLGSGGFSFDKINLRDDGIHHFTGTYLAEIPGTGNIPVGAFSFSITADNNVSGEMVNIVTGTTQLTSITGTLAGEALSLQTSAGFLFEGVIDLDALTYVGNWSDNVGIITTGTFTANGCSIEYN